jgi:hypothetical protein
LNEKPAGMTMPTTGRPTPHDLQLAHQLRQHRLAGTGRQRDQQLGFQEAHQPEQAQLAGPHDQAQHHDHVHHAGPEEHQDQVAELGEAGGAVGGSHGGERTEGADGRQAHDPPDDPEHHVRQCADDLDQGFGVLAAHVERHAEHDGHQQCGEDALTGQRAEERLRDQRGDEAGQRQFLGGRLGHPAGVEGRGVDVHPGAGLEDVADEQADQHRQQ